MSCETNVLTNWLVKKKNGMNLGDPIGYVFVIRRGTDKRKDETRYNVSASDLIGTLESITLKSFERMSDDIDVVSNAAFIFMDVIDNETVYKELRSLAQQSSWWEYWFFTDPSDREEIEELLDEIGMTGRDMGEMKNPY